MGQKEKLIKRLKEKPKDFTFDEAATLLGYLGYTPLAAGKTGGSRVAFLKGAHIIRMHRPHPRKELLRYQIDDLLETLNQEGLL